MSIREFKIDLKKLAKKAYTPLSTGFLYHHRQTLDFEI